MVEGCGVPPAQNIVRPATQGDVSEIAELHVTAINEGFLSSLGVRFLRRLYARIATSRHGFLIVAHDGDESNRQWGSEDGPPRVIGFVAGATSVRGLYREFLVKDGFQAAVSSAPQLARSLPGVFETLRYGAPGRASERGPVREDQVPRVPESELLAIAVAEGGRRRGTGAALVAAFQSAAAARGSRSARVVVGADNRSAIALYEESGFRTVRHLELHAGTTSLLLGVALRPPVNNEWQ
jgi:ribosomal protein S18 acetylase RimI-like enzyme